MNYIEYVFSHLTIGDYISASIGIVAVIAFMFKVEGDKFEDGQTDFNPWLFFKKNLFDFVLVIIGGFAVLIVASEITTANPDVFTVVGLSEGGNYKWVLSLGSGLFGGRLVEFILKKIL
jgi:hypothetical protein